MTRSLRIPGGLLIAVEGIDGAGKTCASGALAQWCGERGLLCTLSKEPTGLRYGKMLRESAKTGRLSPEDELELFRQDRADHARRTIRPVLEQGGIVILDRYYWSTAAYQGSRGLDVHGILVSNEAIAPRPDVVLLLDLEVKLGLNRIRLRGDIPNDFEEVDALEQARQIFLRLHHAGERPSALIDASLSPRDVLKACLQTMQSVAARKLRAQGDDVLAAYQGALMEMGADPLILG